MQGVIEQMQNKLLTIGDVAKRTGTNVSAIRFYCDRGLLPEHRAMSGHRLFHRSVIRRVSFILVAQSLGYRLAEIKDILQSLPRQRTPSKHDWQRLSKGFARELDDRILGLQRLKDRLDACIGCGCLSLRSCRLYNPDDRAAKLGSGAHYLLGEVDKPI